MLLLSLELGTVSSMRRGFRVLIIGLVIVTLQKVFSSAASSFPCGSGWKYSSTSGKCYHFSTTKVTWDNADRECRLKGSPQAIAGETILTQLDTPDDVNGLNDVFGANLEPQWTTGYFDASRFGLLWNSTTAINMSLFSEYDTSALKSGNANDLRVLISYTNVVKAGKWTFNIKLHLKNKDDMFGYYCEYRAKSCPPPAVDINFVNTTSMIFMPNRFTIQTKVYIACRPGYFRESELNNPLQLPNTNLINCSGTAANNFDPNKFEPQWEYVGSPEECHAVRCPPFTVELVNVLHQPDSSGVGPDGCVYDHKLPVNCTRGYVSWKNPSSTKSYVLCGQARQVNKGKWLPSNYEPCVGVRCSMEELLARSPINGHYVKAVNRMTQNVLSRFQMNGFNVFDFIVTMRCNDGFFFPDRAYEKTIICDLKDDLNPTIGQWKGFQGTTYPTPESCVPATCKYQDVSIKSDMFLLEYFLEWTPMGQVYNKTDHSGADYPYQTILRLFCEGGYMTANEATEQNLTCGPQGRWVPNLTPCQIIRPKLNTGQRKHYQPPTTNAPGANEVGATAIVFLVVFFLLIILLDLTTITKDVKIFRRNLEYLKLRIKAKSY